MNCGMLGYLKWCGTTFQIPITIILGNFDCLKFVTF